MHSFPLGPPGNNHAFISRLKLLEPMADAIGCKPHGKNARYGHSLESLIHGTNER